MVPEIRSSRYTSLFSNAFPALRESSKGSIQEPALPTLRNLVVVNNSVDSTKFQDDLHGLKCAIDWRELMVWREDTNEKRLQQESTASLHKDDVISLQFTRLVCIPFIFLGLMHNTIGVVPLDRRKQYRCVIFCLRKAHINAISSSHIRTFLTMPCP
jgi:hypothetical protein